MGQSLALARSQINKLSESKEVEDTLNLLFDNADKQISLFKTQVLFESKVQKQLEARKQIMQFSDINVKVEMKPQISQGIQKVISTFAKGQMVQGVSKLIQTALESVLGSFVAGKSRKVFHLITLGLTGSIIRVDYMLSAYNFKGTSISQSIKTVLAYCYIVTSVDNDDVQLNEIQCLVDLQYEKLSLQQKQQLIKRARRKKLKKDGPYQQKKTESKEAKARL